MSFILEQFLSLSLTFMTLTFKSLQASSFVSLNLGCLVFSTFGFSLHFSGNIMKMMLVSLLAFHQAVQDFDLSHLIKVMSTGLLFIYRDPWSPILFDGLYSITITIDFDAYVVPDWVSRRNFKWESLGHILIILWTLSCFQAHHVLFLPQVWIQPFLQGLLVPFSGKQYLKAEIWTLGVLTALEVPVLPSPLGSAREYLCVCVHVSHALRLYLFLHLFK